MSKMQHDWMTNPQFAKYLNTYECKRCGLARHYQWSPGWPGSDTFYTPEGDRIKNLGPHQYPDCVERDA